MEDERADFDDTLWLGTPATCELLGLTAREVYRLIDTGKLPAYKFGRVIRLRRTDVESFGRPTA